MHLIAQERRGLTQPMCILSGFYLYDTTSEYAILNMLAEGDTMTKVSKTSYAKECQLRPACPIQLQLEV